MDPFFSRLSYSFGNEDWQTERKALDIQPTDRVLCITASGDRPLNLLVNDCKELVALDLNPIQNHLLQLKMTAMTRFDYNAYLGFLGAAPCNNRKDLLLQLHSHLPPTTAVFWTQNIHMIEKGILYQGATERMAKTLSTALGLWRKKKISRLFKFNDIEEQRRFVKEEWDSYFWKKAFRMCFHPILNKFLWKDPGLYAHLEPNTHPGDYLYGRINTSLNRQLAKTNLILSFVFLGHVGKEGFPPYLTQEGTAAIRKNIEKITIRDHNLVEFLEKEPSNSIDCFSISDVASYLSPSDYQRLLKEIYRTGRPNARFCLRQFMSNYTIPKELDQKLVRNSQLEKQLEAEDETIVYRFLTGKVHKAGSTTPS